MTYFIPLRPPIGSTELRAHRESLTVLPHAHSWADVGSQINTRAQLLPHLALQTIIMGSSGDIISGATRAATTILGMRGIGAAAAVICTEEILMAGMTTTMIANSSEDASFVDQLIQGLSSRAILQLGWFCANKMSPTSVGCLFFVGTAFLTSNIAGRYVSYLAGTGENPFERMTRYDLALELFDVGLTYFIGIGRYQTMNKMGVNLEYKVYEKMVGKPLQLPSPEISSPKNVKPDDQQTPEASTDLALPNGDHELNQRLQWRRDLLSTTDTEKAGELINLIATPSSIYSASDCINMLVGLVNNPHWGDLAFEKGLEFPNNHRLLHEVAIGQNESRATRAIDTLGAGVLRNEPESIDYLGKIIFRTFSSKKNRAEQAVDRLVAGLMHDSESEADYERVYTIRDLFGNFALEQNKVYPYPPLVGLIFFKIADRLRDPLVHQHPSQMSVHNATMIRIAQDCKNKILTQFQYNLNRAYFSKYLPPPNELDPMSATH